MMTNAATLLLVMTATGAALLGAAHRLDAPSHTGGTSREATGAYDASAPLMARDASTPLATHDAGGANLTRDASALDLAWDGGVTPRVESDPDSIDPSGAGRYDSGAQSAPYGDSGAQSAPSGYDSGAHSAASGYDSGAHAAAPREDAGR